MLVSGVKKFEGTIYYINEDGQEAQLSISSTAENKQVIVSEYQRNGFWTNDYTWFPGTAIIYITLFQMS